MNKNKNVHGRKNCGTISVAIGMTRDGWKRRRQIFPEIFTK